MRHIKVKIVEIQLGIGLNMFFPQFHRLIFTDSGDYNKVLPVDASFGDKYKSVAKSARNKNIKL